MKLCPNDGCGCLFITNDDLEKHMRYHCGNEENPFQNQGENGEIKRNTLYGFGIPKEDLQKFHGKIFFNRTEMTWNCTICDYKRDVYQWHQVYGHVKSQHCYTSRVPNERWNIPRDQLYREYEQLPQDLKEATKFAILSNKIRLISTEPETWECVGCGTRKEIVKHLLIHIGMQHKTTKRLNVKCPYCPFTFHNLGNMKVHLQQTCPNKPHEINNETWTEIQNQNQIQENNIGIVQNNNLERMGTYFGRIEQIEEEGVFKWKCRECPYAHTRIRSIRGHLTYVHQKTKTTDIHCPYCKEWNADMGKLKRHIFTNKCKIPVRKTGEEKME